MSTLRGVAGLMLVSLVGCGPVDPIELLTAASQDFAAGNYDDALAGFGGVQDSLAATEAQQFQARRDGLVCVAYVEGDVAAGAAFAELRELHPGEIQSLYTLGRMARGVSEAGCMETFTAVIGHAQSHHPSTPCDNYLQQLVSDANAAAEVDLLGELGYLDNPTGNEDLVLPERDCPGCSGPGT